MTTPRNNEPRQRAPSLQHSLKVAWEAGVSRDYTRGQCGTERDLQACFYFHLRALLGTGEQVFVEPRIPLAKRTVIPDLCIIGEQEAWVLELKLQNAARQGVVWESDFQKFADIARQASTGLKLEERGDFKGRLFPAETYYLYAAVGDRTCGALTVDWLQRRAADVPTLKNVLPRIYWAGGITDKDKKQFEGPVPLMK